MNREIARNIRKDIRDYNKKHIQHTIEQNKSLKVLKRKLNNDRNEITKIKNKNGEITLNRKEILTVVEKFYKELYRSQKIIQNSPKETKRGTRVINQDSDELPEITRDEIRNAFKNMKNGRAPGDDGVVIEAVKLWEERFYLRNYGNYLTHVCFTT